MSQSAQPVKEELQRRIRSLTTILHRFTVQQGPSSQPQPSGHSFLCHFTTLLMCNEKYDMDAKRVIAVTASVNQGQPVQILIAAQDPHGPSSVLPIFLRPVQNRRRSLDEAVEGYYSHTFE